MVEQSRTVTEHTAVYDLEPEHTAERPLLRRIKAPTKVHPFFDQLMRSDAILDCLEPLVGPNIRFQGDKLNMKTAAIGSPVEWHQDVAFYPHTNDDLLAVGVALDDCTLENGCLLVIPGSHRGPTLDHHQDGYFVGAISPSREDVDLMQAVPVEVRAGGISIHHVAALHGSAPNTSTRPRRLLLYQYAAADAWPLSGTPDYATFDGMMVRGRANEGVPPTPACRSAYPLTAAAARWLDLRASDPAQRDGIRRPQVRPRLEPLSDTPAIPWLSAQEILQRG